MNRFDVLGEIVRVENKRFTPAGLPILNFLIKHDSIQNEVGLKKKISLEINSVIVGNLADKEMKVGEKFFFRGFLEKKSKNSKQIIFHIDSIKNIVN